MGHSRQQYEDQIRGRLGELGLLDRIPPGSIVTGLETALAQFGRDFPILASQSFSGDASTTTFTITGWLERLSQIVEVEYPAGKRPPDLLAPHEYRIEPGTGDLTFLDTTPATGVNNIVVRYTTPAYPFPDDSHGAGATDTVPDHFFPGVAALAASYAARDRALEFAQNRSASVAGVQFDRDPDPLFSAARELRGIYSELIKGIAPGDDDGSPPGYSARELDRPVSDDSLFHRPGW